MSEPSQQLGCWVVKFPAAKESKASLHADVHISGAIGSHSACPAQQHPTMDRTCWQPAPGSLSSSLSKLCTQQALVVHGHPDFGMQFKDLEKRLPCSKHLRIFQAKMQVSKHSALPVWVLYSLFRFCVCISASSLSSHSSAHWTCWFSPKSASLRAVASKGEYDTRNSTSWLHYRTN